MIVKLLAEHNLASLSLKSVCTGLFESTHVKIPHCWKSYVATQIVLAVLSSIAIILLMNQKASFVFLLSVMCLWVVVFGLPGLFPYPLESWIPLWNFGTIIESLMRPNRLKIACLAQKPCILYTFSFFVYSSLPRDIFF